MGGTCNTQGKAEAGQRKKVGENQAIDEIEEVIRAGG